MLKPEEVDRPDIGLLSLYECFWKLWKRILSEVWRAIKVRVVNWKRKKHESKNPEIFLAPVPTEINYNTYHRD